MTARTALRRRTIGVTTTAIAVLSIGLTAVPAAAADDVTINLVTVNDFHGRIENESGSAAGIAALAGAVNQVRERNPHTVFAAAGDLVGASTFTSFIQNDEPTIAGLTAAGLDVSSVGNHEFDQGWADLRDRIQPHAGWQYIASNLHDAATGDPIMPEYYTETFDGVTIGFVGAVTNELPSLVSPAGMAGVVVGDVAENVNRVADDLRDGDPANGEADVVVLLVHEGATTTDISSATDSSTAFGRIVTTVDNDVDAIVSGHTHLPYNHVIDGRPVISSGQYGERFSDMEIIVDPATKTVRSMTNTLFSLKTNGTLNYPEDATILSEIVVPAKAIAKEKGSVSLGEISADFNRAVQPGATAGSTVENRGGESTLGNWVADVQLWAAQRTRPDTKIAFMNPGGLRADMKYAATGDTDPAGNVTYQEAAAVQPFANTLVTTTLTGLQIRAALEQQWQPAGASRPFLKLGVSEGLTYTYDPAGVAGAHIRDIWLDGEPLSDDASYGVVVNSFLGAGGDNFPAFAEGSGTADSGLADLQTVVDWFSTHGTATPATAQRAVGVSVSGPADGVAFTQGDKVTLDLSGLDFTTSESAAESVTATLGANQTTVPVDRALATADDNTGRATLSITVPEDVEGSAAILVTTPAGTSVQVPITVHEAKVATTTVMTASKVRVNRHAALALRVNVSAADRGAITGTVTIYDGDRILHTETLKARDRGAFTLKLKKLGRGTHTLRAVFSGDDRVRGSESINLTITGF